MRGRPPLPHNVLKARGSKNTNRLREPKPDAGIPDCPWWLSNRAKLKWKEMVQLLSDAEILTKIDGDILAQYCEIWDRWRMAEEYLMKKGSHTYKKVYTNRDGEVVNVNYLSYPEVAAAKNLSEQLLKIQKELGLTPASRPRINLNGKPQKPDEGKDPLRIVS